MDSIITIINIIIVVGLVIGIVINGVNTHMVVGTFTLVVHTTTTTTVTIVMVACGHLGAESLDNITV